MEIRRSSPWRLRVGNFEPIMNKRGFDEQQIICTIRPHRRLTTYQHMLFPRKNSRLANENLICLHFSRNLFISFSPTCWERFFYIKQKKWQEKEKSRIESLERKKRALIELKSAPLENFHNLHVKIRSEKGGGGFEIRESRKIATFVRHHVELLPLHSDARSKGATKGKQN